MYNKYVRLRGKQTLHLIKYAGVAELAYATDLKSVALWDYGFDSRHPHQALTWIVRKLPPALNLGVL